IVGEAGQGRRGGAEDIVHRGTLRACNVAQAFDGVHDPHRLLGRTRLRPGRRDAAQGDGQLLVSVVLPVVFGLSAFSPSSIPCLNSFCAWPSDRASLGSWLLPNRRRTITSTTIHSGPMSATLQVAAPHLTFGEVLLRAPSGSLARCWS